MTNVVQPATNLTNNHRPLLHGELPARRTRLAPQQAEDQLELRGGVPQTIYVSIQEGVPMFALPGSTQAYPEIAWYTNGFALMITFVLAPGITKLSPVLPVLWFSDTYPEVNPTNQMCCVPSVPGEYHFNLTVDIDVTLKEDIDPRIVVTPIT